MKSGIKTAGILLLAGLLYSQGFPVSAQAEQPIRLTAENIKVGEGRVEVTCEVSNGENITNGKIRIRYDGSELYLTGDTAGKALDNAMYVINDCLTGNKEEGEIVLAFAGSGSLGSQTDLLKMEFEVADSVAAGDVLDISASVEELGQIQEEEYQTEVTLAISVESAGGDIPGGTDDPTEPGDIPGGTDDPTEPGDIPGGTDDPAEPGDTPGGTDDPAEPGDTPGGTDDPAEPGDTPGGTDDPAEPGDTPGGTDDPAEPGDTPGGTDDPAEPGDTPGGTDDPAEPGDNSVKGAAQTGDVNSWALPAAALLISGTGILLALISRKKHQKM